MTQSSLLATYPQRWSSQSIKRHVAEIGLILSAYGLTASGSLFAQARADNDVKKTLASWVIFNLAGTLGSLSVLLLPSTPTKESSPNP